MHLYLDESYRADRVYVLAALAVYDRLSQEAIADVVTQTIVRFKEYLRNSEPQRFNRLPYGKVTELKGAESRGPGKPYIPGLNDYPKLRDSFFSDLTSRAYFRIYVLYYDHPEILTKWMPKRQERKYGRLLQNLIADVEVLPPDAQLFSVTIDSQSAAKRAQQGDKLYQWRKRRAGQRKQRIADKARHRRWIQQIDALIRARYGRVDMNRKIWLVPSHQERCLQVADIIANFSQRYQRFRMEEAPYAHHAVSSGEKEWFDGYRILADRIWWIHNRRLRKPKHVFSQ